MKRLLLLAFIGMLAISSSAQKYQDPLLYGENKNRIDVYTLLGIPNDTFSIPSTPQDKRRKPHIAAKGNTLYLWDTTAYKWNAFAGGSGSADSTIFATLYRLDTMRTNLYQRLGLKLNLSDTASMLTNYVRAKRLSDTASAIRAAFPKFGTSTDDVAYGSRNFDANGNFFIIKNIGTAGGIFTNSAALFDEDVNPGAYLEFTTSGPPSTMQARIGSRFDQYNKGNIYVSPGYDSTVNIGLYSEKAGKISGISINNSAIYVNTNAGAFSVDSMKSAVSTDSVVLWRKSATLENERYLTHMGIDRLLSSINGVPSSRTITINGTTYDLSTNRSWTINGDFYTLDGTFSGNRRANLDGYRLTFDSGQVRYRDTMTSSTGKLYGMISDYGRAGVEHINYDSLITAYHSVNTVTGVKFGVKDQNNLDTNNYIQVNASGAYAITGAVSTADSSDKIATTKWVKQQLYGSGGSSDGNNYLTSVTYEQDIRTMNFSRSGLADLTVQLPLANSSDPGLMSAEDKRRLDSNSYLLNPIHPDSLLFQKNDSVMQVKSVTVESQLPDIAINTVRTDTTLKHQLIKLNISEPVISFTAGAGFAADTTVFTDSTLYGSFFTGQDSFYVTKAFAVLKGQSGDTLGIQVVYNDTFNVTGTVVGGGTLAVNNRTTGNSFDISTNSGIPPNVWVWLKSPTVVAGKKPEYLSVTLIGYRRYVAP